MNWSRAFTVAAVSSLCMMPTAAVRAADVVFTPAVNIAGPSDVSTLGTLIDAYTFGFTDVTSQVVNGVTFAPFVVTGDDNPVTVGNYTLFENQPGVLDPLFGATTFYGSTLAPFSNLPANYQAILASGAQSFYAIETLILTMNNLTPGQLYQVQVWTNYSSDFNGPIFSGTQNIQGGNGNLAVMNQNTTGVDGGTGQYVLGTFIADGTGSQALNMNGITAFPTINAFQLRAIPEPATLSLLAIAGLSSLRRRRQA